MASRPTSPGLLGLGLVGLGLLGLRLGLVGLGLLGLGLLGLGIGLNLGLGLGLGTFVKLDHWHAPFSAAILSKEYITRTTISK